MNSHLRSAPAILAALALLLLGGCALLEARFDDLNAAMKGRPATIMSFDQSGTRIDQIEGKSVQVAREAEFDSTGDDGYDIPDSEVLRISVGDDVIHHVGSSMLIIEDGITAVSDAPTRVELESLEPGTPWLNHLYERTQNAWDGKSKTVIIRSQDGLPIAVFAGDSVEVYSTDIPKSTRFQIDGHYLFAYRVDFTVYDTALLAQN